MPKHIRKTAPLLALIVVIGALAAWHLQKPAPTQLAFLHLCSGLCAPLIDNSFAQASATNPGIDTQSHGIISSFEFNYIINPARITHPSRSPLSNSDNLRSSASIRG